jgi:tetratricopeptide (TPR) repeat protein
VLRSDRRLALLIAIALGAAACPLVPTGLPPTPSLHLQEVALEGDPTRQASTRLVLQGLDADERGEARRAQGLYDRALQIDSGNPYAYLALARHLVEAGDPQAALEVLARARDLLEAEELDSPRVQVHLVGLRGAALRLDGREADAERRLSRAAEFAPDVWGDATLTAAELR